MSSSNTEHTPTKPTSTKPKVIGWTRGHKPIYSKPNTGPRSISKGGKKSKVRRSGRRRHHRQNRTQRHN